MGTIITNIRDLVTNAATEYISENGETFKSTVPGPQGIGLKGEDGRDGVDGTSVTVTSVQNNIDKSITIVFSDGTTHTTDPLKGKDGTSITITNVTNNGNGTLTIDFSDGTSHTTQDLTGPRGFKGDTGDHVHHISYQRSKDTLGNEVGPVTPNQSGYTDTYAMWLSQEELPEMYIGEFTVYNGLDALTVEERRKFDSIEFGATADQEAFEVVYDSSVSGLVADNVQGALDSLNAFTVKTTEKGQPDGVASLDSKGLVPASQLPSYVDDVLEVNTYAELPLEGESGKIYIVIDDETNGGDTSSYRWTGTVYAMVSNTLTAEDVKALYESNADTNAYTDAEKSRIDINIALTTTAQTLPTAINEIDSRVVDMEDNTTLAEYNITDAYTKTESNTNFEPKNANIQSHISSTANPHGVTKAQVGLNNVDNTSDANKPISTATQTALNNKVDKVAGKGLSTEDYTTAEKTKLSGLNNYVKPANEPISYITGLQTALNTKVDKVSKQALDSNNTLRVSGRTVSLYKGDGTFDSITTQDTVYTLPTATSTVKGGIEIFSDTVQTVAASVVSSTADRTYGIQLNSNGQAVVNVPWSDTNTTYTHPNSGVTAGTYPKVTVNAQGHVTAGASLSASDIPSLDASKITSGTIDPARLPSFVDDVLEFTNLAGFPATGETGKIYIALDTNKTYRWSGSTYVYITSGAVDSVAGKTGVVTLSKGDVGLGNVDNTSDINKPISTATQNALNTKVDTSTNQTIGGVKTFSSTITGSISGNAATATKLATSRTINGVSFDGTANIVAPTNLTVGTRTTTAVPIESSSGTNASIPAATTTLAGVMSSADKGKLDGIAANANNYTLPTATATVKGGIEIFSDTVQTVASNTVSTTAGRTYGIQLNAAGQAVVNVPWVDTSTTVTVENVLTSTSTTNALSAAQGKELNTTKANINSPTFTGVPRAPTASVGTNTTQLATTEFVVNELNKIEEW